MNADVSSADSASFVARLPADGLAEELHQRFVDLGCQCDLMVLVRTCRSHNLSGKVLLMLGAESCAAKLSSDTEVSYEVRAEMAGVMEQMVASNGAAANVFEEFDQHASSMTEYLYLGNKEAASNREWLTEVGITHILNVADDVACFFDQERRFQYLHLAIADVGQTTVSWMLSRLPSTLCRKREQLGSEYSYTAGRA
jgi:hypothetical protein